MARSAHNDVLDSLLTEIATSNQIHVCSQEPTTRTEAITTYSLAGTAVTPGTSGADFTLADGDVSGRKVTVGQQTDVAIASSGTGNHIALVDGSTLLFVTTCTAQALTSGGTVTIPAFDIEVEDPAAP